MSDADYAEWVKFHLIAETSIDNQEELLLESALKLETNLTLLGKFKNVFGIWNSFLV